MKVKHGYPHQVHIYYDYEHLLKSIRNNWLTEKTSQLQFLHNGALFLAKWGDLEMLYKTECKRESF